MERPPCELKGFEKTELNPNETKRISLEIDLKEFKFYDSVSNSFKDEKMAVEIMVGSSSRDIRLASRQSLSEKER